MIFRVFAVGKDTMVQDKDKYEKINDICREYAVLRSACRGSPLQILQPRDFLDDDFYDIYDSAVNIFGLSGEYGRSALDPQPAGKYGSPRFEDVFPDEKSRQRFLFDLRVVRMIYQGIFCSSDKISEYSPLLLDKLVCAIRRFDESSRPAAAAYAESYGYSDIIISYLTNAKSESKYKMRYIDDLMTGKINDYIEIGELAPKSKHPALFQVTEYPNESKLLFRHDNKKYDAARETWESISCGIRRLYDELPVDDISAFADAATKNSQRALDFLGIDLSRFRTTIFSTGIDAERRTELISKIKSKAALNDLAKAIVDKVANDHPSADDICDMVEKAIDFAIVGNPNIKDARFPETKQDVVAAFIRKVYINSAGIYMQTLTESFAKMADRKAEYFYNPNMLIFDIYQSPSYLSGAETKANRLKHYFFTALLVRGEQHALRRFVEMTAESLESHTALFGSWCDFCDFVYEELSDLDWSEISKFIIGMFIREDRTIISPVGYIIAQLFKRQYFAASIGRINAYSSFGVTSADRAVMHACDYSKYSHSYTYRTLAQFLHSPWSHLKNSSSEMLTAYACVALDALDYIERSIDSDVWLDNIGAEEKEKLRKGVRDWFEPIVVNKSLRFFMHGPNFCGELVTDDRLMGLSTVLWTMRFKRLNDKYGLFNAQYNETSPVIIPEMCRTYNLSEYRAVETRSENASKYFNEFVAEIKASAHVAKRMFIEEFDRVSFVDACASVKSDWDKTHHHTSYTSSSAPRLYHYCYQREGVKPALTLVESMANAYEDLVFPPLKEAGELSDDEIAHFRNELEGAKADIAALDILS